MITGRSVLVVLSILLAACGAGGAGEGDDANGGAGGEGDAGGAGGDIRGGTGGSSNQAGAGGSTAEGGGGGASDEGGAGGESTAGGQGGTSNSAGTGGNSTGGSGAMAGASGGAGGQPDPVVNPVPEGGLTAAQETEAINFLKTRVDKLSGKRENGHVVELHLWSQIGSGSPPSKLRDSDLARIDGFNRLRRLEVNHPNISKEGAEVIRKLPSLEFLGFQYMANTNGAIDPDYMLVAEAHRDRLEVLSFKHLFGYTKTSIQKLGVYSKLRYAVLDNQTATNAMVPFLKKNPSIVGLEIHRTNITGSELKEIADALPKLECLHLKKASGPLTVADIQSAFGGHPALKVLWPHGIGGPNLPGVRVVDGAGYRDHCSVNDLRPSDSGLPGSL